MPQCGQARNHPPEPRLNSLANAGACSAMQSRVEHGMDDWNVSGTRPAPVWNLSGICRGPVGACLA
eukprot:4008810-Lingulodinium_polyedra.AAC.1